MYSYFRWDNWKVLIGFGLIVLNPLETSAGTVDDIVHQFFSRQHSNYSSSVSGLKHLTLHSGYGQMPMAFEANEGQTDSRVRFIARGSGYNLFVTDLETVMALNRYDNGAANYKTSLTEYRKGSRLLGQDVLRLSLTGASRGIYFEAQNPLPGISNYFIGHDRAQWKTKIKQYSQVMAHDVYPGIDMVYYGKQGQLEYDFRVKPGGDPKAIRLQHAGADSETVDDQGNLRLIIGIRSVQFKPPTVYQEDGVSRTNISGKYITTGKNEIGFEIGDYDKTKILIIDPALDYSTYVGGSGGDQGNGIAVDASGNAYVIGNTSSTDFPTTAGAYQTVFGNGSLHADAFVTKLNPAGTALIYSTYLGGSGNDYGTGVAVDSSGDAYVTGYTTSTNFSTTSGAYQTVNRSSTYNTFITKLNAAGSSLIYSTYLGGSNANGDSGYGISLDSSGNAYVVGTAFSSNFPTTSGAYQTAFGGGSSSNVFITKLNSAGSALIYSTFLGVGSTNYGLGVAVDVLGNAYVTGYTSGAFPTTSGAFQTVSGGGYNAFVAKINPAGGGASDLVYSTYLSGSTDDWGHCIAVDASGNAYVSGEAESANFPTTGGAYQTVNHGGFNGNAFVTKLNSLGSSLIYSTFLGGIGGESGTGIAVDFSGNAYVTGYTQSHNFPTTSGAYQTTSGGNEDVFVTELNSLGNSLFYSTYLGGNSNEAGYGDAVDVSGNVYVTGYVWTATFWLDSLAKS
jgi:hypothetical protein